MAFKGLVNYQTPPQSTDCARPATAVRGRRGSVAATVIGVSREKCLKGQRGAGYHIVLSFLLIAQLFTH